MQILNAADIFRLQALFIHALAEALNPLIHSFDLPYKPLALKLFKLLTGHTFDCLIVICHRENNS